MNCTPKQCLPARLSYGVYHYVNDLIKSYIYIFLTVFANHKNSFYTTEISERILNLYNKILENVYAFVNRPSREFSFGRILY